MYMNQTKKRLSIINLAISITDIETIQLQILKLALLKTDTKIQEIITVLQSENYAKAQRLIKVYIDTPIEDILQRASQQKSFAPEDLTPSNKKDSIISNEDQKIIDEFQLFTTGSDNWTKQEKKKEININDYLPDVSDTPDIKKYTPAADFDTLLNLEADEVMPDNIKLDISPDTNDSFFDIPVKEEKVVLHSEHISRDTFFDINKAYETNVETLAADDPFDALLKVETDKKTAFINDALSKHEATQKSFRKKISHEKPSSKKESTEKTTNKKTDISLEEPVPKKSKVKTVPEEYPAISYIRQKFVSMKKQYEPIQKGKDRFPTVETFLTTISQNGYKEKEIQETLGYVEKLITEEKFAEAAQLLLVCASTESKFAQLMLARELYRGVLLRKKVSEAFTILTHMSDDNYPEALCDLGQFYENGISTGRDKKIAQELYQKAMDLGIKRAEKHYARLKKQNKGFFN